MAIHVLKVKDIPTLGDGFHADGNGLYLRVQACGTSRSWVYRYTLHGKRAMLTLGTVKKIPIAQARATAQQLTDSLLQGEKPKAILADLKEKCRPDSEHLFKDIYLTAIDEIAAVRRWRGVKTRGEWTQTLTDYAVPVLGRLDVSVITSEDILAVLRPQWERKTQMARKLLSHLTAFFDWCIAKNYRANRNPATWKELQFSLPSPAKIHRVQHFKAVDLSDLPELCTKLIRRHTTSADAALFGTLTATRVQEFIYAKWDEIDWEEAVWSIPSERRKDGVALPHRVPLSRQAIELLKRIEQKNTLIFTGQFNSPMYIDAPRYVIRSLGYDATMHGMRSAFRDWCAKTKQDWVASEKALSHSVGNKVTQAYLRTDMLEERRIIMQQWADFLTGQ